MNLIKLFPEIKDFFKCYQFSNEDLDTLKENIKIKYKDLSQQRAALSLVALELAKYKIQKSDNLVESKNVESRNNDHLPTKKQLFALDRKIVITENNSIMHETHSIVERLETYTIIEIASSIKFPIDRLIKLLNQRNIFKSHNEILLNSEFDTIKEFFKSRVHALLKEEKTNKYILAEKLKRKNKVKSGKLKDDVYSIIKSYGVGKIIYIRL